MVNAGALRRVSLLVSQDCHNKVTQSWWLKKTKIWDFPGGPVVKNPPSNSGDMKDSILGWESKISCATGQRSPHFATREKSMHHNQDLTQLKMKIDKYLGKKGKIVFSDSSGAWTVLESKSGGQQD